MKQFTYEEALYRAQKFHYEEPAFILYCLLAEQIKQTELLERIADRRDQVIIIERPDDRNKGQTITTGVTI